MKNVVYIVNSFPVISETFVLNQMKMTIESGYNLNIYTNKLLDFTQINKKNIFNRHKFSEKIISPGKIPSRTFLRLIYLFFFSISSFKYNGLIAFLTILLSRKKEFNFRILILALTLKKNKLDNKETIYHAQFGNNGVDVSIAKKFNLIKGKLITTFHGKDANITGSNFYKLQEYYRELNSNAKFITANTEYLKSELAKIKINTKITEIFPMSIDSDFFMPSQEKIKSISLKIISIGRLVEFKGHKYGIEAINVLIKKGYNIKYTIVGYGPEKENLIEQINKHNLSQHIDLVGPKNSEEVLKLFQTNDLFLMTSITDSNLRRETQGVVTGEAQSCELPVVGFRSGGVPYTIIENKTGFLVKEKDTVHLAKEIEKFIENPSLLTQFGKKGREFILKNYSNSVVKDQLKKLYQGALKD